MLETGNLTAGISTLDSSISLLGNCSAQPYCVAGTSLLRQSLLAAGVPSMSAFPSRLDDESKLKKAARHTLVRMLQSRKSGKTQGVRTEGVPSISFRPPTPRLDPSRSYGKGDPLVARASALADAFSLSAPLCLQSAKHNTGSQHQKAD